MEKYYLKGLEITKDNPRVIVTGQDYEDKDFGGVFPEDIIRDGKLEVIFLGDEQINGGCFPKIIPAKNHFDGKKEVLVNLEDVERIVSPCFC